MITFKKLRMQYFTHRVLIIYCFIICLSALPGISFAQFRGGNDDGTSVITASNLAMGRNIYLGGADDGHALFAVLNQPMGRNIYVGGNDDGHALFAALNQPMGRNIYLGGVDDGTVFSFAANQLMGRNIFMGGIDDGHAYVSVTNLPLGNNFYKGGADDGWAFAMGNNLVLVPVTLKSFDASWKNEEDVRTNWVTTSEINTHHFEVERSIDGSSFETAASVPAAGNSSTQISYNFTDINVNTHYSTRPSHFYYRLKSVDIGGEFSYSAIVVLPNKDAKEADIFIVYPNPAQQMITIEFKGATAFKQHIIQMYGSDGKVLLQQKMVNNKEILQVGKYPSGTYYLKLINRETKNTQTLKFIIQH